MCLEKEYYSYNISITVIYIYSDNEVIYVCDNNKLDAMWINLKNKIASEKM